MTWFFIALVAPALYGITNLIDKHLVAHYFDTHSVPVLLIVSSGAGLLMIPPFFYLAPDPFSIGLTQLGLMVIVGGLWVGALYPYFLALESADTTLVVPIFQTIPVFCYVLGVFVLGESLARNELIGGGLVIAGSAFISIDLSGQKITMRWRALVLMLLSSFVYALGTMLYKYVARDVGFWNALFWEYIGMVSVSSLLLLRSDNRRQFVAVLQRNSLPIISLNVLNELLSIVGTLFARMAQLLAPIALATAVWGTQPIFVLCYSIFLGLFFPRLSNEDFSGKALIQKAFCTAVIVWGSFLMVYAHT